VNEYRRKKKRKHIFLSFCLLLSQQIKRDTVATVRVVMYVNFRFLFVAKTTHKILNIINTNSDNVARTGSEHTVSLNSQEDAELSHLLGRSGALKMQDLT